jgi:hypothetical protein
MNVARAKGLPDRRDRAGRDAIKKVIIVAQADQEKRPRGPRAPRDARAIDKRQPRQQE